jgi:hypothetical protein
MPFPSETVVTQIQGAVLWVADEFTALYSQLTAWLSVQHHDDGTHSDVTADSLDVEGELTVGDDIVLGSPLAVGNGPGIGINDWAIAVPTTEPTRLQVRYVPDESSNARAFEWRYISDAVYVILPGPTTASTGLSLGDPTNLSGAVAGQRKLFAVAAEGLYDKGRSVAIGVWTDVAFDANNFTANGTMTWTVASGDQNTYRYMLIGNTMFLSFKISTSSVTAPLNTQLRIAIPGGFTVASGYTTSGGLDYNQGAWLKGCCEVASGEAYVRLFTAGFGSANWAASVVLTYLQGQIIFEVA